MSEPFNPYHRFLGIPPEEQPPNHYRLLGVELLEADLDVIESAVDRQMAHLRTFQGKHCELSQKLLNEVAAAKVYLLNADAKSGSTAAAASGQTPPRSARKACTCLRPVGLVPEPVGFPAQLAPIRCSRKRAQP